MLENQNQKNIQNLLCSFPITINIKIVNIITIINITKIVFCNEMLVVSKFGSRDKSRDTSACAHNINRTFLRNTLKIIQLNVLYHIFTGYKPELIR